jgi:hypothetical protein
MDLFNYDPEKGMSMLCRVYKLKLLLKSLRRMTMTGLRTGHPIEGLSEEYQHNIVLALLVWAPSNLPRIFPDVLARMR